MGEKNKNTPSHYRERIDRLRRRAVFLRARIALGYRSPQATNWDIGEASALEWAVAQLEPWYAKAEASDVVLADGQTTDVVVAGSPASDDHR